MSSSVSYPPSIEEFNNHETNHTYTFTQFVTPMAERERHERRRPKYTRSKSGCLTCRRKKIKCDERKPVCQRCTHSQLDCTWPPAAPPSKKARRRISIAPKIDVEPPTAPLTDPSSSLQVPESSQVLGESYIRGRSEPRTQLPSDADPLQSSVRHHSVPEASRVDGSYTYHAATARSLSSDIMTYTAPHYSFPEPSLRVSGPSTQTSRPSTANSQSSPFIGYRHELSQLPNATSYSDVQASLQANCHTTPFEQYASHSRLPTANSMTAAPYVYQHDNMPQWQPQPLYPPQPCADGYATQTFTYSAQS